MIVSQSSVKPLIVAQICEEKRISFGKKWSWWKSTKIKFKVCLSIGKTSTFDKYRSGASRKDEFDRFIKKQGNERWISTSLNVCLHAIWGNNLLFRIETEQILIEATSKSSKLIADNKRLNQVIDSLNYEIQSLKRLALILCIVECSLTRVVAPSRNRKIPK
jgi:hypothetical protein